LGIDLKKCPNCGEFVDPNDKYCACCGKNLEEWESEQGFTEPDKDLNLGVLTMFKEAVMSFYNPMPLKVKPSTAVFEKRQPRNLKPYLGWAIVMLCTGLVIAYGEEWYHYLGVTIAGYAAPVILLTWVFRSDRYEREPIALVAYCFGWGAFSGILAAVLNSVITVRYLGVGGAGFIEEPLKIIGVYFVARGLYLSAEFNDHLDGMVYGAAAGAGFAGLENFYYIFQMVSSGGVTPIDAVLVRSLTAFMHISWTAIAGRSLGLAKVIKGSVGWKDLIPGVTLAALMHMTWNLAPGYIAFIGLFPLTLIALRTEIKMALQDEARWGFLCFPPEENTGKGEQ
jgi:RsiW-degrading membrane proteinase PrsW (M82 family)